MKRFPTGFFATVLTLSVSLTAVPTEAGVSIIRDAETEQLLRDYVTPIFHAAGINTGAARIILIGDKGFNAFLADGQKIFINVGALMDAKTPNEVIGVLAHESGHIAGGHLERGSAGTRQGEDHVRRRHAGRRRARGRDRRQHAAQ